MDDITRIDDIVENKKGAQTQDGQEYDLIGVLWECKGCGVVVSHTPQHDKMHNKTRSQV
jgi:hypothetical protein